MKQAKWLSLLILSLVTTYSVIQMTQTSQTKTHRATHNQALYQKSIDTPSKTASTPSKHRILKNYSLGVPEPNHIHGIYVSAYSAGNSQTFSSLVHMVDHTTLNTMVIDMKTDTGDITFANQNPQLKPYTRALITHPKQMMQTLKQHHIYPIARLAVFEDTRFAKANPQDSFLLNGQPWIGRQGQAYTNPFLPAVWQYNVAVAKQVAKLGFEQIQFDFVRFPAAFPGMDSQLQFTMGPYQGKTPTDITKADEAYQQALKLYHTRLQMLEAQQQTLQTKLTKLSKIELTQTASAASSSIMQSVKAEAAHVTQEIQALQNTKPKAPQFTQAQQLGGLRIDAITQFIQYARKELQPYHVKVAVDIFGYTATIPESPSVGQNYRRISQNVDVISPMIYPSLWSFGDFGIAKPDLHPYQLVMDFEKAEKKSLSGLSHPPMQIPWIQDYTASYLGPGNYQVYSTAQVDAQIQALQASGIHQYLIWNPSNVYSNGI